MLWGERDVEGWQETIADTLDNANVSTLLGMNEYACLSPLLRAL